MRTRAVRTFWMAGALGLVLAWSHGARAQLALETVQRNFELGRATLFDRILAEDTVTNAQLADLAASQQYANALVWLQYARGVLIDAQGNDLTADPTRVLRILREDAR